MGLLALKLFMFIHRDRKHLRGQIQARNRSIASVAKRKRSSCQHDNSQDIKRMVFSGPDLPEDIWCHIHSLLPLRDAARVACVSHAFLQSWRCHPNLTFSKKALGQKDGTTVDLTMKIDRILKKHSGIGVKTFELEFYDHVDASYLNSWLKVAAALKIEELTLILPLNYKTDPYDFPCRILADGFENSIQNLQLNSCAFRPTAGLVHLRTLHLCLVHITGDELGCLLSNSSALQHLTIKQCSEITYLKIPCVLQHLSYLIVSECRKLQMIE